MQQQQQQQHQRHHHPPRHVKAIASNMLEEKYRMLGLQRAHTNNHMSEHNPIWFRNATILSHLMALS